MGYLITQIIICLLIAALIGFIIGWLLRGLGCNNKESEIYESASAGSNIHNTTTNSLSASSDVTVTDEPTLTDQTLSEPMGLTEDVYSEPVTRSPSKSHKIEKIEGIGKSLGNSLRKTGIKTTADLVEKCTTDIGFRQVVAATDVIESVVKQWLSMADLMRIPDVDGQFAELLEACDIKSVQDLGKVNPAIITEKMQTVNHRERRIPDSIPLPDVSRVTRWIADAKSLPVKN